MSFASAGADPDTPHPFLENTLVNVLCRVGFSVFALVSPEARRQCIQALLDAGASPNRLDHANNAPLTYATARGDPAIVNALLRAGADPSHANTSGWTALMAAASTGAVSCAIALIKAGANLEAVYEPTNHTPLLFAARNSPRNVPILLRAGARLDTSRLRDLLTLGPCLTYILGVDAAGGWKKYEQAHRKRLATTFAKAFPRLPVDAISHMVDFAFHVGFY